MTREAAIDLLRSTPLMPSRVRQVAVPPTARALSTLSQIDYADAFLVEIGSAEDRTAQQWARAILEDAPIITRSALRWVWFTLGLQLGSTLPDRSVLGWRVRRSTPDFVLLAARSPVGLSAEVLLERQQQTLLFATFVQHENPIARAVWAGIEPVHRPAVRYLLERVSPDTRPSARRGAPPRDAPSASGR